MNQNLKNLLKLSTAESKIVTVCKTGYFSVADLSRKTNLPRMTITDNLQSLKKRGILLTMNKGSRIVYSINLSPKILEGDNVKDEFKIYYKKDALIRTWNEISLLPSLSRVCLLQPVDSLKYSLQKVPHNMLEGFHKEHVKKNIILDAITSDSNYKVLKENLSGMAFLLMKGRATEVNIISNVLFGNNSVELIIFSNKAYFNDWKNEISVEVLNLDVVNFLKQLFEITKLISKKVNHNQLMETFLK